MGKPFLLMAITIAGLATASWSQERELLNKPVNHPQGVQLRSLKFKRDGDNLVFRFQVANVSKQNLGECWLGFELLSAKGVAVYEASVMIADVFPAGYQIEQSIDDRGWKSPWAPKAAKIRPFFTLDKSRSFWNVKLELSPVVAPRAP
ncbi:MAG: hypothetical protein HY319_30940 [Armatimonadetes bacterium]|nr:hypothetical protein [Armatimonadota bacterium]